jgi:hypothetical protein
MPRPPDRNGDSSEIADVAALFGDSPTPKSPAPTSRLAGTPPAGETYDLEGHDEETTFAEAPPSSRRAAPSPFDEEPDRRKPSGDELADVEQVDRLWSRWAESGSHIVALMGIGFASAYACVALAQAGNFAWIPVVLLCAIPLMLAIAYPIIITLERPYRIAPEQCLRDYFGALNHAFPHHRRMWLLLSLTGKSRPPFGTRGQLKAAWREAAAAIAKRTGAKPNAFVVADYSGDAAKGRSRVKCRFTLLAKKADRVLESHHYAVTLVRGADRMWYLDDGSPPTAATLANSREKTQPKTTATQE